MVVGQCLRQQSASVAEGGRLAWSTTGCLSRSKGFFLPRPYIAAATSPFPSLRASSASSTQKKLPNSAELTSTFKPPSRTPLLEPIVDKEGYLCSSRAARELAFSILYAALILGEKPMRVFRDRLKQQSGYLAKDLLASYKHGPDDGDSIIVEDASSAKKLEAEQREESLLEAAVLSAPPSKVYNKSVLMLAQQIVQVTADSWSEHDIILSDLLPKSRKERGGIPVAQLCILQMSMAEMIRRGTAPKIVIKEAVALGQRFVDMRSARIINGCLGKFIESDYYKDSG